MMTTWRRLALVLSLASGVARADGAATGKPSVDDARYAARAWMGALRDKEPERMAKVTAFPFSVEGIAPKNGPDAKRCKTQSAKDAKALPGAAKCLFAAKEFMDDLPADFALAKWKVLGEGEIPSVFDKRKDRLAALAKDHTLVQLELTGEALNYVIVLAVRSVGATSAVDFVVADGKKPE